jgi:hypothetical protein
MARQTTETSHGTLTAAQIADAETTDSGLATGAAGTQPVPVPDAFAGLADLAISAGPASSLPPLDLAKLGEFIYTSGNSGAGTLVSAGPTDVFGGNVAFVDTTHVGSTYTVSAGTAAGQTGPAGGATAVFYTSSVDTLPEVLNFRPDANDPGHYLFSLNFAPSSGSEAPKAQFDDVTVLGWNANSILLSTTGSLAGAPAGDIVLSTTDMYDQNDSLPTDTTFTTTGPAPVLFGVTVPEVPCFATGTEIATPDGPRAVETLCVGDLVLTHDGRAVAIAWVGSRTVRCDIHPAPEKVRPVRIRRHAFGTQEPHRDLLLSPDHAIFTGGVLIPVCELINGRTIVQENVQTIRYVHIELPLHDIVLAEGLPCETLLDIGNHSQFDGGPGPTALHPDFAATAIAWEAACAPLQLHGAHVEAAREMLARRIPQALAA